MNKKELISKGYAEKNISVPASVGKKQIKVSMPMWVKGVFGVHESLTVDEKCGKKWWCVSHTVCGLQVYGFQGKTSQKSKKLAVGLADFLIDSGLDFSAVGAADHPESQNQQKLLGEKLREFLAFNRPLI